MPIDGECLVNKLYLYNLILVKNKMDQITNTQLSESQRHDAK